MTKSIIPGVLAVALLAAWPHAQQPTQPPAPQQPSEISTTITSEGGAAPRLFESIATLVDSFPPETTVYPGHMGITTLGRESATNPFLLEIASQR